MHKRDYYWLALVYLVLCYFIPAVLFWSIVALGILLAARLYHADSRQHTNRRRKP